MELFWEMVGSIKSAIPLNISCFKHLDFSLMLLILRSFLLQHGKEEKQLRSERNEETVSAK
jgi:hypothetical protein